MRKYIFKRLIYMVIALFCIITLTFFLMRIAPGNPFASEKALPANIQAQLNKQYGLSNPWYIQFKDYLVGILKFDFGYSMKYRGRSTNDIIFSSFPVSLALGMQALVIAVGLGTTLGVISATYHNKVRDYAATVVAVLGISVPSFILAGLIQYLFAVHLGWFPVSGWKGFWLRFHGEYCQINTFKYVGTEYLRVCQASQGQRPQQVEDCLQAHLA